MDPELFKQRLTEVAEWQTPKLSITDIKDAQQRRRPRGRPTDEQLFQEQNLREFIEHFGDSNPTMPPELLKLKTQAETCAACGRHCESGRHLEKKIYEANRTRHWREKCVTCNRFQNPYTGEFDLDPSIASTKWNSYLRETKNARKTQGNPPKAKTNSMIQTGAVVIAEDHREIIRIYPDRDPAL